MTATAGARLGGRWATGLDVVTDDLTALDGHGRWAVVLPYDGPPTLARFRHWSTDGGGAGVGEWRGPAVGAWTSSLTRANYEAAVDRTRDLIAAGTIYQANICRVLTADQPDRARADIAALDRLLTTRHASPFGGFVRLPEHGVSVATASPELFVRTGSGPAGRWIRTGPIKGTGRTAADLAGKDRAENVMIVDLMRNDLSRICVTGSVVVPDLLRVEEHPGLVHLVSDVVGRLRPDVGWPQVVAATFPPGSVTGAPKSTALTTIADTEPVPRGPYCGAIGWVDADTGEAELAVAIRTFWQSGDRLHFGTGAGITWGSDPRREWAETELKAERLLRVAAGPWPPTGTPRRGENR